MLDKPGYCEWMILGDSQPDKQKVATAVTEDSNWSFCSDNCNAIQQNNKLQVI